ncbi:MAG: hypothetical protein LLG44_01435 [Chloroflexi bacterium]|nr:hypothetical protein [Chloroflexota bacterium]
MKSFRMVIAFILVVLLLPLSGCGQGAQKTDEAVTRVAPKTTDTVTADSAAAETTPTARKASSAGIGKPKATVAATEEPTNTPKPTAKPTVQRTKKPTETEQVGSDYLPVGETILVEDFQPDSQFPETDNDEYELALVDGAYAITIYEPDLIVWGSADLSLSDFAAEVTGVRVSGPENGDYGFIFRYQDADNFYVFKVADNGAYSVHVLVDDEWSDIIDWQDSDAINLNGSNVLAIAAVGNQFTFYINGVEVDSAIDDTFADGDIALFGSTYDEGNLKVQYTDLKVWDIDESQLGGSASGGITQGELVYSDDFSDSATGWDEWEGDSSLASYRDGKYVIELTNSASMAWGNAYQSFDDFIITVEASKTSGSDDNAMGLVLRYQDSDNFYVFAVSSDGMYTFGYYLDNEWYPVIDWTTSDLINQGESENVLGAAAVGDHFILAINDTIVEDIYDSTFADGDIGLMGGANSEGGIEFAYDNVNVWAAE